MLDGRTILVQREHYNELMLQAEIYRQARQSQVIRQASSPYCQALAWLGRRLTAWGAGLQMRYGDVTDLRGMSASA